MSVDLNLGYTRLIIKHASEANALRNQLAYILATAKWETAHTMEPVREAYWLSEAWRKTNLRYYPHYGRGFSQLTWDYNYDRADRELGLEGELVENLDLALEPDIAARVIVRGMMAGWFTGHKLSDYVTLQASDFVGARRVVNGVNKDEEIAAIAKEYDAALLAEGYGVDSNDPVISLEDQIAELERRLTIVENKLDI